MAIAISLVPPLGVVGVCARQENLAMALGALVLFGSNVVALVLSETFVFTAYGYAAEAACDHGLTRSRPYTALAAGIVLVVVPLATNTVATTPIAVWTERISETAQGWIAEVPGGRITDVSVVSRSAVIEVESPGATPDIGALLATPRARCPTGSRSSPTPTSASRSMRASSGRRPRADNASPTTTPRPAPGHGQPSVRGQGRCNAGASDPVSVETARESVFPNLLIVLSCLSMMSTVVRSKVSGQ